MRKVVAATLLVASLAVPSFAASTSSTAAAKRTSAISRVLKLIKHLTGFSTNDDIIIPRP